MISFQKQLPLDALGKNLTYQSLMPARLDQLQVNFLHYLLFYANTLRMRTFMKSVCKIFSLSCQRLFKVAHIATENNKTVYILIRKIIFEKNKQQHSTCPTQ